MRNLNKHNIVKWYKMIMGKSILHVNQGVGKFYSKNYIAGYYNDLTEKVLKGKDFENVNLPKLKLESGKEIIFPIAVFQYGLGSYDLYLRDKSKLYLKKFKLMVDWAIRNQEKNGAWNNFFYIYPDTPYSAMCQGEGASLLIRAYIEFKNDKYLVAAKKAINFMLTSINDGGTTLYKNDDIFFYEFTNKPIVLNGWIFALFGLYDYMKISNNEQMKNIFDKSLNSIVKHLSEFDNGYWSKYNIESIITSPFYHNLHIAQLLVLYDLFNVEIFNEYANKWIGYKNNWFFRKYAFFVKVFQKLNEK